MRFVTRLSPSPPRRRRVGGRWRGWWWNGRVKRRRLRRVDQRRRRGRDSQPAHSERAFRQSCGTRPGDQPPRARQDRDNRARGAGTRTDRGQKRRRPLDHAQGLWRRTGDDPRPALEERQRRAAQTPPWTAAGSERGLRAFARRRLARTGHPAVPVEGPRLAGRRDIGVPPRLPRIVRNCGGPAPLAHRVEPRTFNPVGRVRVPHGALPSTARVTFLQIRSWRNAFRSTGTKWKGARRSQRS